MKKCAPVDWKIAPGMNCNILKKGVTNEKKNTIKLLKHDENRHLQLKYLQSKISNYHFLVYLFFCVWLFFSLCQWIRFMFTVHLCVSVDGW